MPLIHSATGTPYTRCGILPATMATSVTIHQTNNLDDVTCPQCLNSISHDLLIAARRAKKVHIVPTGHSELQDAIERHNQTVQKVKEKGQENA